MARLARVIAVGIPHHVTQRGNARRFILDTDADRAVYCQLLQRCSQLHRLDLLGFCLMSNHVHLIVVPHTSDALALALKETHGRYATYWNARHASSGHVWQGRFYSCPLDTPHFWAALAYTELNPVRARLVADPEDYRWSSAAPHCGWGSADIPIDDSFWRRASRSARFRVWGWILGDAGDLRVLLKSTPFGVEVRYPSDAPELVDGAEAEAIRIARQVRNAIESPLESFRAGA